MPGLAVADTLAELGADVLVLASTGPDERFDLLTVLGVPYVQADLREVPAELTAQRPDVIIVSPGFHPDGVGNFARLRSRSYGAKSSTANMPNNTRWTAPWRAVVRGEK
jgi:NAD(P)-dependent dehydrogenase (short-subunit alcohol dehydrogenase family)